MHQRSCLGVHFASRALKKCVFCIIWGWPQGILNKPYVGLHGRIERSTDLLKVQEAAKLVQASEQQMQTALNNVDGAIDFIISAEREHPNRIDICKQNQATSAGGSSQNPFSAATQPASAANPFVAPSPFSANSFGAPSQQTTVNAFGAPPASNGTFGQPSSLGQKPSAFGAPSQVFGAPSQLGGGGAFGQPSALGQKQNPFGAPSSGSLQAPSNTGTAPFSSFAGAANPFTQQTQTATSNPFDTPSQLVTPGAFGAPSQPAQSNVFGQPSGQNPTPFGASNLPSQSPFGGVSVASFGAPSPAPKNPFASPTSQTPAHNPFAAVSAPQQAPFKAAMSAPPANPFANPRQDAPLTANPLGTSTPTDPSSVMANTFASNSQPQQSLVNGDARSGSTGQHPSLLSYSSKDGSGRLTMFKGKRVTYRGDEAGVQNRDGSWEKIWFPEGAPALNKDTEMEDSLYDDSTKAAYMNLRQTGRFQGGAMPLLPPKRDWCSWDF